MGRNCLFFVLTVVVALCVNISHQQMVFLKQNLDAIELYLPLETCNVSQFAFAAFSRVAAGHKVNSSWGRVHVRRNKHNHERLKPTLMSHCDISHLLILPIISVYFLKPDLTSKCAVRNQLSSVFKSTSSHSNNSRYKQRLAVLLTKLALTYWEVYQWKKAQPQCLQEVLLSCLLCRAGCHKRCSWPVSHTCFWN